MRVIDGDTLEVYIDGRQIAIGIIGIKAPRVNSRCGRKAAELMNELANGSDGLAGAHHASLRRRRGDHL